MDPQKNPFGGPFFFSHKQKSPSSSGKGFFALKKKNGEGEIRTHGPLRVNGFQDRRFRPLSHLSKIYSTVRQGPLCPNGAHFIIEHLNGPLPPNAMQMRAEGRKI